MTNEQKRLIAVQLCSMANKKEPVKRKFLKTSSIHFSRKVAIYYGEASIYEINL